MSTFAELRDWSASALTTAAEDIRAERDQLAHAHDLLGQPSEIWTGAAAVEHARYRSELTTSGQEIIRDLSAIAARLDEAASQVATVEDHVRAADGMARQHEFHITGMGVVLDSAPPRTFPSQDEADAYLSGRMRRRDEIVTEIGDALLLAGEIEFLP